MTFERWTLSFLDASVNARVVSAEENQSDMLRERHPLFVILCPYRKVIILLYLL
jgi:hypothetical protein